ncbi:hypothetical protein INR49_011148 [Caranx melampygus]|nr:hypothetical protein INR49_011148 [Caranx melampygus]
MQITWTQGQRGRERERGRLVLCFSLGDHSCDRPVMSNNPDVHRLSSTMSMYQVKPICGGDIKIDLPTCMYKLPNIHAQQGNSCTSEHALQNGEVDPAVKSLEARQDEIMRKLYELKAAVEGLAKTVTTQMLIWT